ncbi:DUF6226 family protein [Cellulomonas sp. Y8]|uniref:DUF6226 family protein n=1 Tax=Cellulomonas sp. Y8 TaxID=2591145 RepID=UPI0011C847B8|nr:DUF6226 family protein [Cellulomonas sp. Y8]
MLLTGYTRPDVRAPEPLDADGRPVRYGERWPDGPPAEAYGRVSHPERFAPLHAVADALVRHLVARYDVDATDDPACAGDVRVGLPEVARAVRLAPRRPAAAALTVVWTAFPGVVLHAGLLQDFPFPVCGCDACDEPWPRVAGDLEWHVGVVVGGGYREWATARSTGCTLRGDDRGGGGTTPALDRAERRRAREARDRLAAVPDGWAAWPRR